MSAPRLDRLRELFAAALPLGEVDRATLLDRECGGDASLRASVEHLLSIDSASTDDRRAASLDGVRGAEWLAADLADDGADAEPLPARIGHFVIIREIGRGGMGIVYEAQQDDPSRRVALKVIHPGMISRGLLRRFRQETRAMGQLLHPGIARIYEAGTGVDGAGGSLRPYFVMELVEGPTLLQFANRQPLDTRARLEMIARVCEALHHAHQKGVIHRDIKPDNIVVQTSPEGAGADSPHVLPAGVQPKVLDFGVARLAEEQDTGSLHTQAGQIVGTIPYLAPEQAEGQSAVADIRSDVYSTGVVAFELLCGSLPFDTASLPVHRAVRVVLDESPRRLGSIAPWLRGDIETIVHKAMDRSPDRRYQSAADLAADIRRYLANEPIAAHRPSIVYQTRKFVARHRALVGGSVAAVLMLIAGVIVVSVLAVAARRSEAKAQWERYRSAVSAAGFAVINDEVGIARRQLESTPAEFRGWEYRHLMGRIDQSTRFIGADRIGMPRPYLTAPLIDAGAGSVVVVGDDESLALASVSLTQARAGTTALDPRLYLWYRAQASLSSKRHAAPGPVLHTPGDEAGGVRERRLKAWPFAEGTLYSRLSLAGNGQVLAFLALRDGRVAAGVIDLRDDACRRFEFEPSFVPIRLALDQSGTRLALAGGFGDGRELDVRVIDTNTGDVRSIASGLEREVQGLQLSRDGARVAASLFGGGMGLWDVSTPRGRRLRFRSERHDSLQNLTFSHDESMLAGGTVDGLIRVYDARSLEPLMPPLVGHEGEILGVSFLGDDSGLVSTGRDGGIRFWRLDATESSLRVLTGHHGTVMPVALARSASGPILLTGGWDRTIKTWDLDGGGLRGTWPLERQPFDLSVSPDQTMAVCMEADGVCRVFEVRTGRQVSSRRFESIRARPVAFHADNRRVLIDWQPGRPAMFWDVHRDVVETAPAEEMLRVQSPAISTPARVIAIAAPDPSPSTTSLYSIPDGAAFELPGMRRTPPEQLAFSPDGTRVAAGGPDNRIDLYDLTSRQLLGSFIGHTQEVLSIAFSPDGSRLFSSDYGGVIWVWSVATFDDLVQLRGHGAHVRRILVTPDGESLISASGDATVRIWSAPDGRAPRPRR